MKTANPPTLPNTTPQPIDHIIDQMGELAQHQLDDRLGAIRAKLDTASSLEEVREILDAHIEQLDFSEYATLFAEGMTAATLLGRARSEKKIVATVLNTFYKYRVASHF